MNIFFLYWGLPGWIAAVFTIALVIVLLTNLQAIILFFTGWAAIAKRPEVSRENADQFHWVFLVPALNEEVTIRDSVDRLVALEAKHKTILVIDDGSDDATPEILAELARPELTVLRREKPNAQVGKAAALNDAWRYFRENVATKPEYAGFSDDQVIFVVVDADGRLDPLAANYLAGHFLKPEVGGVQLSVRIYNRYNPLAWMQDVEFGIYGGLYQTGRTLTGTASMGGNGQANRLTALNSVVGDHDGPWRDYLTEDQDLGLTLIEHGWDGHHESRVTVAQQGLSNLRALYRQRTRWSQGNIQTLRHVPLLRHGREGILAKIDLLWAVLQPPLQAFIGFATLLAIYCAIWLGTPFVVPNSRWLWLWLAFLFFLGFGGTAIGCISIGRGHGPLGYLRGLLIAIPYAFYSWILWPVIVRAFWRQVRGATGWAKTAREPMEPDEGARS
ncbi:MAG: glycosyltransferase family 2 protein [Candidatus Nanopelagicales bacterium]